MAFPADPPYRDQWRCDRHPRSSPDGPKVGINSSQESGRQIYGVDCGLGGHQPRLIGLQFRANRPLQQPMGLVLEMHRQCLVCFHPNQHLQNAALAASLPASLFKKTGDVRF